MQMRLLAFQSGSKITDVAPSCYMFLNVRNVSFVLTSKFSGIWLCPKFESPN